MSLCGTCGRRLGRAFPSNRRFFNDVFAAYQELFSGEALLTRLINHDGNGNEKIQNKSTSLMSKTKTLNARASHFSGGSATALFGKILYCQRKSNLVNLDQNANAGNRRCSL